MSSALFFKLAGSIFLAMPIPHTQMFIEVLRPGLQGASSIGGHASSMSWNQANGYFITTALLCFKWAKNGGVPDGMEKYIFMVLMATQLATSVGYGAKGVTKVSAAYAITSLLMGIGAAKGI